MQRVMVISLTNETSAKNEEELVRATVMAFGTVPSIDTHYY